MSVEKYIPDIEELISGFEKAGYEKEASELRGIFAAYMSYPQGPLTSRLQGLPRNPRVTEPTVVEHTDGAPGFQEGDETEELTQHGPVPSHYGLKRPSLNKFVTEDDFIDLEEYFGKNELYGYGAVNRLRAKIMEEQKRAKETPGYVGSISYFAKDLQVARERVEALKKPVEEYKRLQGILGIKFSQLGPEGINSIQPKDENQRKALSQFNKLHKMLAATSMGVLDAKSIDDGYQAAMNDAHAPDLFKKQLEKLKHLWTVRSAARMLKEAAMRVQALGRQDLSARMKTAAIALEK